MKWMGLVVVDAVVGCRREEGPLMMPLLVLLIEVVVVVEGAV